MIGHFRPKNCKMSRSTKDTYFNLYCSLCKSLRKSFGFPGMFLINNELTIILLAVREYFKPEETKTQCPAKLFFTRKIISQHEILHIAADLSFLLAWLKISDHASDTPSKIYPLLIKGLKRKAGKILKKQPPDFISFYNHYLDLTTGDSHDFPYIKRMSGRLSREMFQRLAGETTISPYNREKLGEIFSLTGELIATADPLTDVAEDLRKNQYNPIIAAVKKNNTSLLAEFNHLKSEFEKTGNSLKEKLLTAEQEKVSNHAFFIVMDLAANELRRKIIHTKDAVFQPDFQSKPMINTGIMAKRLPVKRSVFAHVCDCDCDCCDCCHCGDSCDCGDICHCSGDGCHCCDGCSNCCDGCDCCCDCCECGTCGGNRKKKNTPPPAGV